MAHHKRRRPKSRRAGCLYCKPYKANGAKKRKSSLRKQALQAIASEKEQIAEVPLSPTAAEGDV
jgi:hypothetical protein